MNIPPPPHRAAFLDRDGVINVDYGYVHHTDQLTWVTGAIRAIRRLNQAGYMVLVVTNQAGVARGYYDEAQIGRFHDALSARLASENARIDAFYHCPFHADAVVERYKHPDHPDRKPNPGMLLRAIKDWSIDVEQSFLVGDKESDVLAAQRAGVKGHLFAGGDLDEFLTQTVGVQ